MNWVRNDYKKKKVDYTELPRVKKERPVKHGKKVNYTMKQLVSIVQIRLSNVVGQPVDKRFIKIMIEIILLSLLDLAKFNIPVVLTGFFKLWTSGVANTDKLTYKFKISKPIKDILNGSKLFFSDDSLLSLEDIKIKNKLSKYESSLLQNVKNKDKSITKGVMCGIMDSIDIEKAVVKHNNSKVGGFYDLSPDDPDWVKEEF